MLHMRVIVPSPTTPQAVAVTDVSLSQLAPRIHQVANCHYTCPAAAVQYRTWVYMGKLIPAHSMHTSPVRRRPRHLQADVVAGIIVEIPQCYLHRLSNLLTDVTTGLVLAVS